MAENKRKSGKERADKFAKVAMSPEVIAAGLAAAAAAIAASPKARKKIQEATLEAADRANKAATETMTTATRMGAMIVEGLADAAQRMLSGEWEDHHVDPHQPTEAPKAKPAAPVKKGATAKSAPKKKAAAKKPATKRASSTKAAAAKKAAPKKAAPRKKAATKAGTKTTPKGSTKK
ncbi:hypothetical protein [Sphingomicrobium arenosum]|uniref:hypothetical protein n=1 Tax=Sphingomicrobium arenosum TaxID=2233861 RepID=UPI00223FB046|nr:hypothetical protein [Sphingomicrobium arenosum]